MDTDSNAVEATRRELVQRIERLLDAMEREGREPTVHESLCVRRAIHALSVKAYRHGQDSMVFAERPEIYAGILIVPQDAEVCSLAELRDLLRKAVQ